MNAEIRAKTQGSQLQSLVDSLKDRYLASASKDDVRDKIVFVLGAAASFGSEMPSWEVIRKQIFDTAADVFRDKEIFANEVSRKLAPIIGPPPPGVHAQDFLEKATIEQILSVACETEVLADRVRQLLRKNYWREKEPGLGEAPQLAYEIIAHFLKHRFIDDVVTFNFDEVLDHAVRNELDNESYEIIISDKQFVEASGKRRNFSHVIKLHGTISIPQSLRFTRDETRVMSPEMVRLLDRAFFGGPDEPDPRSRIHLVSFGYSWRDADFLNWVISRIGQVNHLTIVTRSGEASDLLQTMFRIHDDLRQKTSFVGTQKLCDTECTIDHLMWAIWNSIESAWVDKEPFVPAARHILLGYLFGRRADHSPRYVHTSEKRLEFELFLHLLKCKGMMNISVVSEDPRIALCSSLYKKSGSDLIDIDGSIRFVPVSPSPNAHIKETFLSGCSNFNDLTRRLLQRLSEAEDHVSRPRIDAERMIFDTIDKNEFLTAEMKKVFHGPEIEVVSARETKSQWLFKRPKTCSTYYEMQIETKKILTSDWELLLSISESGKWLFDKRILDLLRERKGLLLMINAGGDDFDDFDLWKEINAELKGMEASLKLEVLRTRVPWWRHNRHVTLTINRGQPTAGLYFQRRLKASRISPVVLTHENDCIELLLIFMSYLLRSFSIHYERTEDDLVESLLIAAIIVDVAQKTRCSRADLRTRLDTISEKIRSEFRDIKRRYVSADLPLSDSNLEKFTTRVDKKFRDHGLTLLD
ncbi:MAG: SIR2 family protein [Bacteroidetes bacterium]|nr:SIR2 family protein [Bacteroidota bacterium]MCW5897074.1 SIR2 family protein [Bacteroidota bacterium]